MVFRSGGRVGTLLKEAFWDLKASSIGISKGREGYPTFAERRNRDSYDKLE